MPTESRQRHSACLLPNGIVAGHSLRHAGRFGSTEKDMRRGILLVMVIPALGKGRLGGDGSRLNVGRSEHVKLRGSFRRHLRDLLWVGMGRRCVPALEVGIEVHDCYYYQISNYI